MGMVGSDNGTGKGGEGCLLLCGRVGGFGMAGCCCIALTACGSEEGGVSSEEVWKRDKD